MKTATTPEEALKDVKSGDHVFVHTAGATPSVLTKAMTARPDELKNVEILMISMQEVLGEVVVTAGKFNHKIEDLTISMEVIQPELIQSKNTRSVESVLDQTPGLNILDGEPQIRGGSGFTFGVGSKVAVLVDDVPMLSGDAGRPEWGFVPIENIEQIETKRILFQQASNEIIDRMKYKQSRKNFNFSKNSSDEIISIINNFN